MSVTSPELPHLTADLPGCSGWLKRNLDDFVVEELPRYPACGEGTHFYATIEKRGITTHDAVRRIARAVGCKPGDVGYAGMKDAHGVTRQRISIEHVDPQKLAGASCGGLRVVAVERHTNKLRVGHLAGNRFDIRLRGCGGEAVPAASTVLEVLTRRGVPNYFGPQRFGRRGTNAQIGRAVLAGDFDTAFAWLLGRPGERDEDAEHCARALYDAGDLPACAAAWPSYCRMEAQLARRIVERGASCPAVWRTLDRRMRTLYYSACQSAVFNRVLAERIADLDAMQDGDVAWKHANGACFSVTDAAVEQPRCDRLEISPTGPVPGARMTQATGVPGALEAQVCAEWGLSDPARRTGDGIRLDGARRPLRVPLAACELSAGEDENGPFLRLVFELPPGAYATSVVREITKSDAATRTNEP